jgi:hypothetical protein
MIRTVWLGVFFLTSLVALVAVRIGAAPLASADVPRVETTTAADTQQATSKKADKLQVSYIEPAADRSTVTPVAMLASVTPVAIVAPKSAPKPAEKPVRIVSRHWHDPLAPKSSSKVDQSKSKPSKASRR